MRPVNLDFTIEQLVLHGMNHIDHAEIGPAIEQELARLVAEDAIRSSFEHDSHVSNVDGGAVEMSLGVDSVAIGTQIARAICGRANR